MELAPDDDARSLATDWHAKANAGFAVFARSGDQSQGFMIVVTDADFDRLDEAFADAGPEARSILAELRASATIYRHYRERGCELRHHRLRERILSHSV